jgi:putative thioredoxin
MRDAPRALMGPRVRMGAMTQSPQPPLPPLPTGPAGAPMPAGASFNPYGAVDLAALAQARQAQEKADAARARAASNAQDGESSVADSVIDVTDTTFEVEVLQRSLQVPVVMDFWAEWCEPCKQLSPVLERFALEDGGSWVLAKVDVDANPQLSAAAQVQSIPTVLVVWQGQVIPGFQGAPPEAQVRDFITQVIALPGQMPGQDQPGTEEGGSGGSGDLAPDDRAAEASSDPELDAADDALARDDLDGAEAAYRQILATRPEHTEAKQALASVTLLKRTAGLDAGKVVATASGSDDVQLNCQAADLELLGGDARAAFTRLVDLVRRTEGDERDAARAHLVELLDMVGNEVPEVLEARRALASALF